MATINIGRLAFVNKGVWSSSTAYVEKDVVQYTDSGVVSTFIATASSTNQAPSTGGTVNTSYWQLMAKGTDSVALAWDSSIKTANFTAQANSGYFIDTSSGSFTITTPASPSVGDEFVIVDYQGSFATNNLQIDGNGSDKISGTTDTYSAVNNNTSIRFVYSGATKGWITVSGSTSNDTGVIGLPYNVQYLVVGAGGGGGGDNGGGGGGGGMRYNSSKDFQIITGTTYTITVGAGGLGGTNSGSGGTNAPQGDNGGDSIFATITAAGGGGGGSSGASGKNGGSGGGGGQGGSGGSGNTPSTTPSQGNNGASGGSAGSGTGGGGGGAGASGSSQNGGNGASNSITGSAVTYAGGGGGGENQAAAGNAGSGGSGGGGNGSNSGNGANGTDGLGGGAGGGHQEGAAIGGTGGDGVVILRMATSDYSGTTTGLPTVTTDGSDTIIKWTSSGSYTA